MQHGKHKPARSSIDFYWQSLQKTQYDQVPRFAKLNMQVLCMCRHSTCVWGVQGGGTYGQTCYIKRETQEAHIVICEGQNQLDAKGLCLAHHIVQPLPATTYYVTKYCLNQLQQLTKYTKKQGVYAFRRVKAYTPGCEASCRACILQ